MSLFNLGQPPSNRKPEGVLTLIEVVILRRVRRGESQADIGVACGMTQPNVSRNLRSARERFGVDTNDELLALPCVLEQLDGQGETS